MYCPAEPRCEFVGIVFGRKALHNEIHLVAVEPMTTHAE
jgi:hypothetical protein